jgi:hypothetical protein
VTARASVVIPAHNEEPVIGRLLGALAPAAADGRLDVHVICNGCRDRTAEVAAGFTGVAVHTVEHSSKIAALNEGDRRAGSVFPRLYLDADIAVDLESVLAVVAVLERGDVLAAAPSCHVALEGRPRAVRDFYRVFLGTPWMRAGAIGSGFYGLAAAGRARFGSFPEVVNDDLFVRQLFSSDERATVEGAAFRVEAPRTVRALVRAKARVAAGTAEYLHMTRTGGAPARAKGGPPGGGGPPRSAVPASLGRRVAGYAVARLRSPLFAMAGDAELRGALPAYCAVRLAARAVVLWDRLRGVGTSWGQDRTTRQADPAVPPADRVSSATAGSPNGRNGNARRW